MNKILAFLLTAQLLSEPLEARVEVQLVSAAKSGTHLLYRLLKLLNERVKDEGMFHVSSSVHPHFWILPTKVSANEMFRSVSLFDKGKSKVIFLVRDPRDVSVSWVNWLTEQVNSLEDPSYRVALHNNVRLTTIGNLSKVWNNSHFSKRLEIVITGALPAPFNWFYEDQKWYTFFYYQGFLNNPSALVLRFEDLVGPQGGGNKERQLQAIRQAAGFLDVSLTQEDVEELGEELFGNSKTFRKGKIGRWREVYNEEHKRLFKEFVGESLIVLGYEKDSNW